MKILIKFVGTIAVLLLFIITESSCAPNKGTVKNDPAPVSDQKQAGNTEESYNLEDIGTAYEKDDTSMVGVGDPGDSFDQTGNASWYGREFQGKKTASGDKFDMYEMTAAHRTYPFGTILLVKNLENGKTVKVRVNDRGPFTKKRIIDLSYAAGRNIGMLAKGEAMVGIKIISMGGDKKDTSAVTGVSGPSDDMDDGFSPPAVVPVEKPAEGNYELQAGAFYSKKNAESLKEKIAGMVDEDVSVIKDGDFYKVRVNNIKSKKEAEKYKKLLQDENIKGIIMQK